LSPGDELDVLVAFNEYAYENHKEEVADDGVIVFNNGEFEIEESENVLGMNFDALAKQTGNNRAANFVVMGALARLVDLPLSVLEEFNRQRYTRGRPSDEQIISSNNMALSLGSVEADKSGFSLGELADPIKPEGKSHIVRTDYLFVGGTSPGISLSIKLFQHAQWEIDQSCQSPHYNKVSCPIITRLLSKCVEIHAKNIFRFLNFELSIIENNHTIIRHFLLMIFVSIFVERDQHIQLVTRAQDLTC
jgi:hypothetical protein